MPLLKRLVPLILASTLLSAACIELPEIADPESPADAGSTPDGGGNPDAGSNPDSGVPADTTPPTITGASPAHNSTQVATATQFLFVFSEAMDVGTVQVRIAPPVALSVPNWTSGNTQLTVQPTAPLAQNTGYVLTVDGKDTAGNALADRTQFSFTTTGPAPDTTAPTILNATPSDGTLGVARSASITVVFSEPMDKASAQTAFAITAPPGFNAGVFNWNAAGTEMTFKPDANFTYGTEVSWRVSDAARDLSANTLGSTVTRSFRVVRVNTVTIYFDPPTSGSISAPSYYRSCATYQGALVGDDFANETSRTFIGFKMDALPEGLVQITHANLKWWVEGVFGDPFGKFGELLLEQVNVGEEIPCVVIGLTAEVNPQIRAAYETPALGPPLTIPPSVVTTTGNIDLTSRVIQDWANRTSRNKRSQFRLRFQGASDNNGQGDYVYSDVEHHPRLADLEVTYEIP
jgi:hypothetical protein